MDSVKNNTVAYCCVWKDGRILYTYSSTGDNNNNNVIHNLAALCLEMAPPHHRWYFQTVAERTFGFLMDDGYVYFAIVNDSLGNSQLLRFLQRLEDEFRKVGKRGGSTSTSTCTRSGSGSGSVCVSTLNSLCLQEQLLPVVHRLVASLEHVEWPAENAQLTPNANGHLQTEGKALLGKPSRKEKKKMKDHMIAIEMEEHWRSADRGLLNSGSGTQGTSASPSPKSLTRIKSSSQNLQNKWCRQVRIILAIDAAICVVLFIIWLVICQGTECIR